MARFEASSSSLCSFPASNNAGRSPSRPLLLAALSLQEVTQITAELPYPELYMSQFAQLSKCEFVLGTNEGRFLAAAAP